jgi:hypothetical protein
LQQFSLELHLEKTRLIEFGRFAAKNRKQAKLGPPRSSGPSRGGPADFPRSQLGALAASRGLSHLSLRRILRLLEVLRVVQPSEPERREQRLYLAAVVLMG